MMPVFFAFAVAAATTTAPNDVVSEGGLSKVEIQKVVTAKLSQIKYCHDRELVSAPNLEGKLAVFFQIQSDGSVSGAKSVTNTFPPPQNETIASCVTRIISKLKFPPPQGGGVVSATYPFNFAGSVPAPATKPDAPAGNQTTPAPAQPNKVVYEGGLSKEEIQRVITAVMSQIKYCYDRELVSGPNLEGKLAVFFQIQGDGTVSTTTIATNTFPSPQNEKMASCVTGIISKLKFPSPKGGGVVNVTYPFNFSGSGPTTKSCLGF
jgi:hypothetical protein